MNRILPKIGNSLAVSLALVAMLVSCENNSKHIGVNKVAPENKPVEQEPQPAVHSTQAPKPVVVDNSNQTQTIPVVVTQPLPVVVTPVVPVQPVIVPVQPVVVPVQPIVAQPVITPIQPVVVQPQVESSSGSLLIPITPFSNMASGYQATNEGFRAILKDASGKVIAAGPMSIDAAIKGYSDDASQGSSYGRLVMNVDLKYVAGTLQSGQSDGKSKGKLSICMAQDTSAQFDEGSCKSLTGNLHPERPFQWIDKSVSYSVAGNEIKITGYDGETGEGGTRSQIALAAFHPAYGFAAPGKAFKDYQSPIVLDLNGNGKFDLVDVWNDSTVVSFDITDNGNALRTGWIAAGDAFLALDVNSDGKVNSGAELFGEYSVGKVKSASRGNTFENGFLALGQYDLNRDGKIDSQDVIFKKLMVWRDANSNGVTDAGELKSIASASIAEISLAYKSTESNGKPLSVLENEVRLVSTFKTSDGKAHKMADIWFKQRRNSQMAASTR